MLESVLLGLTLGAGTLLFIGPVLFYLIKSSVESGSKAGMFVALGIIVGDIIYVLIVLNGLSDYLNSPSAQKWMALIGAGILFFFGIKPFFSKKPSKAQEVERKNANKPMQFFLNGFILNFVNPFVITVWIGYFMLCDAQLASDEHVVIALFSCLLFIFSTDLLKARLAIHLKQFLSERRMVKISKIFGIVMLLFGLRLMFVGLMA